MLENCYPYTPENAVKIDSIRAVVKKWRAERVVTDDEADLLLHDLILAVNRVANIAGTYGYYRSTWNAQALRPIEMVPSAFVKTRKGHEVVQGPVEVLAA